ncbi:hypothetical protein Pmar_PMAR006604 [Perkinsus marinus ATCC 50983]|uniref:Uncharacterized protein n=1 Tax=Perkinsus marinus (strain ATCC 50983 / TXsc) TaxID=423536 RepID=C5LLQ9_PERM5|nr:hypothetical protein Pmar_PMAR006604 [Perkinsus marinus ATCC 50983]EER02281.1 hypothetical protein Pmar_PMAR006604 [Perkinsus marinus ATCC 50983]|eukprot:XP_002769563.1 hypothetical protein Pmar_PMAR006604 [Perkinsus marinus ATCC 50983]
MGNFDLLPEGKSTLLPSDSIGVSLANALAVLQTLPTFPEILFPLEGWDPELRQYGVHILRLAGKFAVLPGLHIPLVDGEPRGTRCHEGAFLWPALCEQALVALIGDKRLVRLSLTDDILRDLSDSYWVERMEVAGGNWQDRVNESVATENTVVLACTYMSDQDAQGVNDDQINFVEHIDQQRVALRCPFQESPESLVEIDLHTFSGAFNSIITLRNIPPSASRWTFRGRFTCDTCGGTPIPIRQPIPGGKEVVDIAILATWLR